MKSSMIHEPITSNATVRPRNIARFFPLKNIHFNIYVSFRSPQCMLYVFQGNSPFLHDVKGRWRILAVLVHWCQHCIKRWQLSENSYRCAILAALVYNVCTRAKIIQGWYNQLHSIQCNQHYYYNFHIFINQELRAFCVRTELALSCLLYLQRPCFCMPVLLIIIGNQLLLENLFL